jgi:hypothetical protein
MSNLYGKLLIGAVLQTLFVHKLVVGTVAEAPD